MKVNRRSFIHKSALATSGIGLITVLPSKVWSSKPAPSDKINVAYIGLGTQGLRQLPDIIQLADVHIRAVCDPQRKAINYYDWGPTGLRDQMRKLIGNPNWTTGGNNTIPGGLDNGKEIVDAYYAKTGKNYKCNPYTDFRELFEKEKEIFMDAEDAVEEYEREVINEDVEQENVHVDEGVFADEDVPDF